MYHQYVFSISGGVPRVEMIWNHYLFIYLFIEGQSYGIIQAINVYIYIYIYMHTHIMEITMHEMFVYLNTKQQNQLNSAILQRNKMGSERLTSHIKITISDKEQC